MINRYKNYGFEVPQIAPEEYTFGGGQFVGEILRPDGQWDDFLPIYEPQAEKYETSGCTVWGGQNQIETLHKYLFGVEPNYSERFNYILAEVTLSGKSPHVTYETFRNSGLINHELLSVPETYEEFITPKPMIRDFLNEGKKWLNQYEFKHDWVLTGTEDEEARIKILKEMLKYCPLGISVTAWYEQGGIYIDNSMPNTHWCVLYGYDEEKKLWKVFDSYDHSTKLLPFDHKISFAKRISLKKNPGRFDLIQKLVGFLYNLISLSTKK